MSIPNDHKYLRNVGSTKILDSGKVDGSAFRRNAKDVDGVSGNWPNYFSELTLHEALREIRKAFAAKGRKIPTKSKFAQLPIGKTKSDILAKANRTLDFLHAKEDLDPSHAIIVGYTLEDEVIADLIAQAVEALWPGREEATPTAQN